MKVASRVMYNIANFFQWIIVVLSITVIVLGGLSDNIFYVLGGIFGLFARK